MDISFNGAHIPKQKKSFKHENNKYAIMQLGNNNPSSTLIIINFTH